MKQKKKLNNCLNKDICIIFSKYLLLYSMFIVGESMALFTAMSLSALCTNGKMRAGGAYYMISRSLGPEFGGAMAALFFIAYVVGSTFHISGSFKSFK